MEASEEIVSTSRSAGWPASSMALRTSGTRLVTPVEVSLWTTHTALMACALSAASRASTAAGIGAAAPVAGDELDLEAEAARRSCATGRRSGPVSNISTLSPGESVLTSAASQAPVPEAG